MNTENKPEHSLEPIERRRQAAEKALNRASQLGISIDDDPVFAGLIEQWVQGHLSMQAARMSYIAHIKERDQARADWRALSIAHRTF